MDPQKSGWRKAGLTGAGIDRSPRSHAERGNEGGSPSSGGGDPRGLSRNLGGERPGSRGPGSIVGTGFGDLGLGLTILGRPGDRLRTRPRAVTVSDASRVKGGGWAPP